MSLGRLWIPLLDRKYGWIALAIIAINGLLVCVLRRLADLGARERRRSTTRRVFGSWFWIAQDLSCSASGSWFFMFWPIDTHRGLLVLSTASADGSASGRGKLTKRKQLCALFSLQDGTGPDGVERYRPRR